MERPETNQTNIFTTHIIPSVKDNESFQPKDPVEPPVESQQPMGDHIKEPLPTEDDAVITTPQATIIDMELITHVIPEHPEPKSLDPQDELLRWHYRLGHLPFDRIKQQANYGQLPKRLLTCHTPFCAACQYGKMMKRPWRVKGDNKATAKRPPFPDKWCQWISWSPRHPVSSPSSKESSRNKDTGMPPFLWTNFQDTHASTCKNVSPVKKPSWPSMRSNDRPSNIVLKSSTTIKTMVISPQRLHQGLPSKHTKPIILRERSFPEWYSRTPHKGSSGTNTNLHAICHEQMEKDGHHQPVALRHEAHE